MVRKISISASEEQVEKWDEFIGNSYEVENRSELIRRAVSEFIEQEDGETSSVDEELLSDIEKRVEEIENVSQSILKDVSILRDNQLKSEDIGDIVNYEVGELLGYENIVGDENIDDELREFDSE